MLDAPIFQGRVHIACPCLLFLHGFGVGLGCFFQPGNLPGLLLPLPHQPADCDDKHQGDNDHDNGFAHYCPRAICSAASRQRLVLDVQPLPYTENLGRD